ncbi:Aspartic proteinase CDR1, partial [Mucuna pruriens]
MVITTKSQPLYSALSLLGIIHFFFFFPSEGTLSKHSINLIHRDSPLSPLYDPSSTHFDRLHNAFQRSLKRINHFKSSIVSNKGKTQVPMKPGGGEYLMKISLGTPPVEIIGIVDTGSDLIWTQCLPCIKCYNQTIPLFDPRHSKSYHTMSCHSKFCNTQNLENAKCDQKNRCEYGYSYADGSYTEGKLAFETLSLGTSNPISISNIVIGCAHNTAGIFDAAGSGLIGLGGGNLSLISQLGTGGKKFSYCLVPITKNSTSKINFGNDSVVSGPEVVTIPLITMAGPLLVTLEALSVGKERIAFAYKGDTKTNPDAVGGFMIIDTGTTLTLLPLHVYNGLVSALGKVITAKRVRDHNGTFSLCYERSIGHNIRLPIITMHFKGGDVKLHPANTFSWVRKNVVCLTMTSSDIAVLGNLAQMNFLVGYDLDARTVSFKRVDCTKQE